MTTGTTLGEIIKSRREELGATREEICHGICTVSMLYKVENDLKQFYPETLALILERLGMHNVFDGDLITTTNYRYIQTIRQATNQVLSNNTEKAAELLASIEKDYDTFPATTKQEFDRCETLLTERTAGMSTRQKLESFEKIIRYTIEDYNPASLPPYFTDSEFYVLTVIANCYYFLGDCDTAILINRCLKRYLEEVLMDRTRAARSLTLTCNNLAEMLIGRGDYEEALEIAREGFENGKRLNEISEAISSCMYNISVCLLKTGDSYEEAKQMASDAYLTSRVYNVIPAYTNLYKAFLDENF
ncbi:MAG: hypothetical protein LUF29_05640 [Oscillospiraceae bacterium]|nr:hypothetical protein [Oscillospiraceae bacterium]